IGGRPLDPAERSPDAANFTKVRIVVLGGHGTDRRDVPAQESNEQPGLVEIKVDRRLPLIGAAKDLHRTIVVENALADFPLAEGLADSSRGKRYDRVKPRAREIPARERHRERDGRVD